MRYVGQRFFLPSPTYKSSKRQERSSVPSAGPAPLHLALDPCQPLRRSAGRDAFTTVFVFQGSGQETQRHHSTLCDT